MEVRQTMKWLVEKQQNTTQKTKASKNNLENNEGEQKCLNIPNRIIWFSMLSVCLMPMLGFPASSVARFVDNSGIVCRHCLKFIFINSSDFHKLTQKYMTIEINYSENVREETYLAFATKKNETNHTELYT